jgi:hypothetical protein
MAIQRTAKLDKITRENDLDGLYDFVRETDKATLKQLSKSRHYPEWVKAVLRGAAK